MKVNERYLIQVPFPALSAYWGTLRPIAQGYPQLFHRTCEVREEYGYIGFMSNKISRVIYKELQRCDVAHNYSLVVNIGDTWGFKKALTRRGIFLIAANCISIFSLSFSPLRRGVLEPPVRFTWLQTSSSGFSSGA